MAWLKILILALALINVCFSVILVNDESARQLEADLFREPHSPQRMEQDEEGLEEDEDKKTELGEFDEVHQKERILTPAGWGRIRRRIRRGLRRVFRKPKEICIPSCSRTGKRDLVSVNFWELNMKY